jgi:TnpA family transposase
MTLPSNSSSDQFTGFHGIVIPGTLRDSLFILDGLLEQQTSLRPVELMADTAGTDDVVFGLFWLLGYQFSRGLPISARLGSGASTERPTTAFSTDWLATS